MFEFVYVWVSLDLETSENLRNFESHWLMIAVAVRHTFISPDINICIFDKNDGQVNHPKM